MKKKRVQALLAELRSEVQGHGKLDAKTRELAIQLHDDVEALIESDPAEDSDVLERAEQLQVRFAARHPRAEALIREIVDSLAKMGI